MEIDIKALDELHRLSLELNKITYLQGLLGYDQEEKALVRAEFEAIQEYTKNDLWEQQADIALAITKQLHSIYFAKETDG